MCWLSEFIILWNLIIIISIFQRCLVGTESHHIKMVNYFVGNCGHLNRCWLMTWLWTALFLWGSNSCVYTSLYLGNIKLPRQADVINGSCGCAWLSSLTSISPLAPNYNFFILFSSKWIYDRILWWEMIWISPSLALTPSCNIMCDSTGN